MKAWKISDFVLIGILAAVYGVLVMGIGALTVLVAPMMHALSPAFIGMFLGTVVLFVVKKIPKFGALTLFIGISTALFAGFSGMMYVPFVGTVTATAFVVDLVVHRLGCKTPVLAVGYGLIQSAYVFGGAIPLLFFWSRIWRSGRRRAWICSSSSGWSHTAQAGSCSRAWRSRLRAASSASGSASGS